MVHLSIYLLSTFHVDKAVINFTVYLLHLYLFAVIYSHFYNFVYGPFCLGKSCSGSSYDNYHPRILWHVVAQTGLTGSNLI